MSIMEIKKYGEKVLRQKAEIVTEFGKETQELFDNMLDTMFAANGVGLAANQVGIAKRMITIGIPEKEGEGVKVYKLANPEIIEMSKEKVVYEEGCLSFPGILQNVERPEHIKVKAQDETGKELIIDATGLLCVALQHEIDHLNGVVFVDRISPVKKVLISKELKKLQKETKESHK